MTPRALPYLLSAPALLLFIGVVLIPIAMTVVLSFNDWSMTRGIIPEFTLKNWEDVFGDAYFYGIFFRTFAYNAQPSVQCTSCHNQHLMNVVKVKSSNSGLPPGNYATMFFVRGPYNPSSGNSGSNQTAQFCRQCHGAEANEMNGSTAGTTF